MREQKKETRATIERKIKNALVFVPKDKDTIGVFFSDKGLRLEVNSDTAVISTGFHRHVFANVTNAGISRPYLYTKRIIEIALANDCNTENGYSYTKLLEVLKAKEDQSEYNIAVYVEWWLMTIFVNLYSIGESEVESFMVYEEYIHTIARNAILLSEKTDDMTNKQFHDKLIANMQDFTKDIDERILFHKKTDEEVARENIEAIQEQELNEHANES